MNSQYHKIFAHGCSVTHGSDLVHAGISDDNVSFSFPNMLANMLFLPCSNLAFPGNSNENIFHDTIKTIYENDSIILIVCWTTPVRETWERSEERFCVNVSWANVSIGNKKQKVFYDEKNNVSAINSDYLADMANYLNFFQKYKTDYNYYIKKIENYSKIVRDLCKLKKIKLIELQLIKILDCVDISKIGDKWFEEKRHPNKHEHLEIANLLRKSFFK
jgi:hypothetical protein